MYIFLAGVALLLYFFLLAIRQTSELQQSTQIIAEVTEIIGEVEKRGDITNPGILENQQKKILKEIESLKQLPMIPSSKNASLQKSNIQKLQSLLPALQVNIINMKALQAAYGYANTATELARKIKNYNPISGGEYMYTKLDPSCEWNKIGYNWHKAVVTLQGIDPKSAAGKIAQEKLGDYIRNYEVAKRWAGNSSDSWVESC